MKHLSSHVGMRCVLCERVMCTCYVCVLCVCSVCVLCVLYVCYVCVMLCQHPTCNALLIVCVNSNL